MIAIARRWAWDWSAAARQALERGRHRRRLALADPCPEIVADLDAEGIHVTSLDRLALPGADLLLEQAAAWRRDLAASGAPRYAPSGLPSFAVLADPAEVMSRTPELLLWGVQDRLIEIVEAYLRLPARCLGVFVRRDLADGAEFGTRRWHIDINDFRYLKIIVYLNDVAEGGGPFEYVPQQYSRLLLREGRRKSFDHSHIARLGDAAMRSCHGPAGTVIIVDTARLYHRGRLPLRERYTISYSYASRHPRRPDLCAAVHFPSDVAALNPGLSPAQAARLGGRG
jgi:hypothetical protein